MARGWESKSVESQIEDRRSASEEKKRPGSPDDLEREQRRHSLEMSRRRILSELETTQSDARRPSLEAALKHLDSELASLQ